MPRSAHCWPPARFLPEACGSSNVSPASRPCNSASPPAKQPIVVVVLDDHLDRSERFLVQLKHADVDPAQMATPLRDEARSLLTANRVCRKNLGQADDPELSTALDHLDRLLAEAANEPGGLNAQAITKLQDEMNADGLLFEVRVLRSRHGARRRPRQQPGPGRDHMSSRFRLAQRIASGSCVLAGACGGLGAGCLRAAAVCRLRVCARRRGPRGKPGTTEPVQRCGPRPLTRAAGRMR